MSFKEGDIVKRKSYGGDVIFKIAGIATEDSGKQTYILKGVSQRLIADAPEEDLVSATQQDIQKEKDCFETKIKEIESQRKCSDILYRI